MKRFGPLGVGILLAGLGLAPSGLAEQSKAAPGEVLESSELFWVPTMDQAIEMAKATGKPIFSIGYSLVPDGTTYTKKGDDCPTGVF